MGSNLDITTVDTIQRPTGTKPAKLIVSFWRPGGCKYEVMTRISVYVSAIDTGSIMDTWCGLLLCRGGRILASLKLRDELHSFTYPLLYEDSSNLARLLISLARTLQSISADTSSPLH